MTDRSLWRWVSWIAAALLVVGNLLLHKPISDLCDQLFARLGREAYERLTLLGIGALSVAGFAWLLRARIGALTAPRPLLTIAALALMTIAAQRWLLVSNVELIHLPQFGLLAAILIGVGAPPSLAWLCATGAGGLDEAYQRLVIYPQVPNVYFDWNDIVLNGIGAAWVAVVLAPLVDTQPGARSFRWFMSCLVPVALMSALWLAPPRLDTVDFFPFRVPRFEPALTGREYHVMSPSEGIAALLGLWWLVGGAGQRQHGGA